MHNKSLQAIACSVLKPELSALAGQGPLSLPIRYLDSHLHMCPEALHDCILKIIQEERQAGSQILLICGDCSPHMAELASHEGTARVRCVNCGEMLLGKERHQSLMKEGAFLLLPEWAERWEEILSRLPGLDVETTKAMMRDMHTHFVYLHTGVRPVPHAALQACTEFFGLPCHVSHVGLDHLQGMIREALDRLPDPRQGKRPSSPERSVTAMMLLDIIMEVLKRPDHLSETALQLSHKIRELTGARMTILAVMDEQNDGLPGLRVLAVNPPRHADLSETGPIREFIEASFRMDEATVLFSPAEKGREKSLPADVNLWPSLIIPLKRGEERIGVILSLGLLDAGFVSPILQIQEALSGVVSVVLKNALLMERQQRIRRELEQEIHERRRTEEALRRSEQRFRSLVETTSDWVWEIDGNGFYTYVSPKVEDLLGYRPDEVVGKRPLDFLLQDEVPRIEAGLLQIMVDPVPFSALENINVRKDGRQIVLETSGVPIFDENHIFSGYRGIDRDITDRKRAEEALKESEKKYRELSVMDNLTQLYNSWYFYKQLQTEIDRTNRYQEPLTLILLDVDNFKTFNDAYGHVEGDQVLQRLGEVIKRCIRKTDTACRYGGEEFVILLPVTKSEDGVATAERIRIEFKKETFSPVPGIEAYLTLSIGLGQYKPPEETKVFVHRIDRLMYQAKKNGKDRVCFG